MTKLVKKRAFFSFLLLFTAFACTGTLSTYAKEQTQTIQIRILSTGDLHGQATAYDYETNTPNPNLGLSKIASLIEDAKAELPSENSLLIDAGDFLYDYSTNYFYESHPDTIQPLLQIMDSLNYDCITLGNHELDYPWEYVINQLIGSNLWDKTIVSNLYHAGTDQRVFAPSKIITRDMTASNGKKVTVKIGIVGATRQALSTRREYYGFLSGADIYSSVSAEAKRLKKEEGVDVIIALIHGGIGVLSGANTTTHPGGRLAKLDYIDAVVTSHSHEVFPAKNGTYDDAAYKKIVDEQNGLIHSTPVVGVGSHAAYLGLIDLTLAVNADGTYQVCTGSSDVRPVTKDVYEKKVLSRIFNPYMFLMIDAMDKTEYPIAKGLTYTNLDCFIQDSALFQLYNNAKLSYAHTYISENLPEYENLPVIACTSNLPDNGNKDIVITDSFTEAKIAQFISESSPVRDSGYIHMFKISGWKLREWLEYNASIYATAGLYTFEAQFPSFYKKSPNVVPLLQSAYNDNHSSFYIFDGISYTIDISQKARYFANGKMIASGNRRISSLTYQGVPIRDDQEFILICDSFSIRYSFMPEDSSSVFKTLPWKNGKEILMDYIKQLSLSGSINIKADNNWKIAAPSNFQFAVGMPMNIRQYIEKREWFTSWAVNDKSLKNYPAFYKGTLKKTSKMKQNLNVILAASTTKQTSQPVNISVITTVASGVSVKEIRYLTGLYKSTTNSKWETAPLVNNNTFTVDKNKTYTVRVIDSLGNKMLRTVTVTNINKAIVDVPIVSSITNRIETLTGTAPPGAAVYVKLPDKTTYSMVTDKTGAFSFTLPLQKAFSTLSVYTEVGGKKSKAVSVLVRRTGPDLPMLTSDTKAPTNTFMGKVDEYCTVFLRYGNTIYVNKKDKTLYEACDYYKSTYKISEGNILVDSSGNFHAVLKSNIASGKTIWIYAIDKNRKCSRGLPIVIGQGTTETPPANETDDLKAPDDTETTEVTETTEAPEDTESIGD